MSKKTIFARILAIVAEETEISQEAILSKTHREEVVDARHILIYFLSQHGFHPCQIADFIGIRPRSVTYALTSITDRVSASLFLRNQMETIRKRIRDN